MKLITPRHALTLLVMLIKTAIISVSVLFLCRRWLFMRVLLGIVELYSAVRIIASEDSAEYKIPWLVFILLFPAAGCVFYLLFYKRRLSARERRALAAIKKGAPLHEDFPTFTGLYPSGTVRLLVSRASAHVYGDTAVSYFGTGEEMLDALITDISGARKFVFLEFFLIADGVMWQRVTEALKECAARGVEVKIIYDDLGCMRGVPRELCRARRVCEIEAYPFFRLRSVLNNEFNNRTHRKIAVIDGEKAYTGGVNMADEYINLKSPFGLWKDAAVRIEGSATDYLTYLFLSDLSLCTGKRIDFKRYYRYSKRESRGYVIPYGDTPRPLLCSGVSHALIRSILSEAREFVYITTPYLIPDGEVVAAIENAAERGVDVRIITPHVPDKKLVFSLTRSSYARLLRAGVRIYEFTPGFIHAKLVLSDGECATVGTANLDYRSLAHNLECGVLLMGHPTISKIRADVENIISKSKEITDVGRDVGPIWRVLGALMRIFAPLL